MKRLLILVAALAILVAPAALAAPPADKGKPENPGNSQNAQQQQSAQQQQQQAQENAAKACKAERGTTTSTIGAFKDKYGTNANGANAFGKCVSQKVATAAKSCKKLQKDDPNGFKTLYGDKPNAYGKCVSANAKKKTTS
jgi:type II secretory pathway pseudopilin PulG